MLKKLIIISVLSVVSFAMTSLELAKKADEKTSNFKSSKSIMKMILTNAYGQKTIRDLNGKTLEGLDADKSLMEFLNPADVKGTKMLTHEYLNKDDNQWLYLPALKRIKRIASSNKSGSFMGSEFSYEDIANPNYKKFTYLDDLKIIKINGVEYYQSTRVPKDKNSGYSKQITLIHKNTFLVYKIEYYDRKKELLKTAIFDKYRFIKGVYRIKSIKMINHQNSKSTSLIWLKDDIKVNLNSKDFTKRKLKR